tara:strand:+ start:521 stop:1195 length:675 start_codon:yes stop_codon:yes gene_type:complete
MGHKRNNEMLYTALNKAQEKIGVIDVDEEVNAGGSRGWNFASLKAVVNGISEALRENDLVVTHMSKTTTEGDHTVFGVTTKITHIASGAFIQTFGSTLLRDPGKVQECGTLITYWRRYNLQMLLNLRINKDIEDTDGEIPVQPEVKLNPADEILLAQLTSELNELKTRKQVADTYTNKKEQWNKLSPQYQERLNNTVRYIAERIEEEAEKAAKEKSKEKKDEAA